MDKEEFIDLLDDVVDALANKRLMQKHNHDKVGVTITTHIIDRCKDAIVELRKKGE